MIMRCHFFINILLYLLLQIFRCSKSAAITENIPDKCEDLGVFRYLIFDAGSSKTRLYMYSFQKDKIGMIVLKKYEEVGKMTALSELGSKASHTTLKKEMNALLNQAKDVLENYCLEKVYVYLRATAGLRALPIQTANEILVVVREVFSKSLYKYVGDNSAQIMSGIDEGFWLWVFMNFAKQTFTTCGISNKITSFDLGGGSTQMTTLTSNIKVTPEMTENIIREKINDCEYEVYSVSYEGFGAQATRMKYFADGSTSVCIADGLKVTFKFGDTDTQYTGVKIADEKRYNTCKYQAQFIVKDILKVWDASSKPTQLELVSAFYYIPKTAHAVKNNCKSYSENNCDLGDSYVMNIIKLKELAKYFCENPVSNPETIKNFEYSEYLCIDLIYVITLLNDGYGLEDKEIQFRMINQIDQLKVGWPMGFAYGLCVNYSFTIYNNSIYFMLLIPIFKTIIFEIFS